MRFIISTFVDQIYCQLRTALDFDTLIEELFTQVIYLADFEQGSMG